jgi:hypothetical protein
MLGAGLETETALTVTGTVKGTRTDTPQATVGSVFQNTEPETVFRNEIPFFMVMLTKSSKI